MKLLPKPQKSAGGLQAAPRQTETVDTSTINTTQAGAQALAEPPPYDGAPWPAPFNEAAFHGLAGDVIRRIEPHTESDPAALLVQFLIAFGNAAGRSAYWRAEATHHYTNEFAVIVGQSAIARKGTSLDRILSFLTLADSDWSTHKIGSGLASGEGVIFAIRDPKTSEGSVTDEGVADKRLLVTESEFAQALSAAGRKDNTLSAIIRNCWDGKTLRSLIKNSGKGVDVATAPHVSILAHVTAGELKAKLAAHDATNGFSNRFLWVCASRSKMLPFGGDLRVEDCQDLTDRLRSALAHAKDRGETGFTPEAAELWVSLYETLSQARSGIIGSVTDRGPAHVRRLAVIYALLDKENVVDIAHLNAALAVWNYCFASAEFIFGGLSATARDIYERLRLAFPGELARTDLFGATNRHIRAEDLTHALAELARYGLATSRKEFTDGAPRVLWRAIEN